MWYFSETFTLFIGCFRGDAVFGNDTFHIFFELGYMAYYQSPQEFGFYGIVSMDYAVTGINNCLCVWKRKITLYLQYAVYGLAHYFRFTFNGTSAQIVVFKNLITHRVIDKKTFHFIDGTFDVEKVYGYVIIHKSTVFPCQPGL